MKWMLVVMVFGSTPVETDIIFNSLGECLKAEDAIRSLVAEAYNTWRTWARANPSNSGFPGIESFAQKRIELRNGGTCVPHAASGP